MYFWNKHVETGPNCSHELAVYLKCHMPLKNKKVIQSQKTTKKFLKISKVFILKILKGAGIKKKPKPF